MALYLGNSKVKIISNNKKHTLNLYSSTPIFKGAIIKSSDNYVLKDSQGLFLTVKESE